MAGFPILAMITNLTQKSALDLPLREALARGVAADAGEGPVQLILRLFVVHRDPVAGRNCTAGRKCASPHIHAAIGIAPVQYFSHEKRIMQVQVQRDKQDENPASIKMRTRGWRILGRA